MNFIPYPACHQSVQLQFSKEQSCDRFAICANRRSKVRTVVAAAFSVVAVYCHLILTMNDIQFVIYCQSKCCIRTSRNILRESVCVIAVHCRYSSLYQQLLSLQRKVRKTFHAFNQLSPASNQHVFSVDVSRCLFLRGGSLNLTLTSLKESNPANLTKYFKRKSEMDLIAGFF